MSRPFEKTIVAANTRLAKANGRRILATGYAVCLVVVAGIVLAAILLHETVPLKRYALSGEVEIGDDGILLIQLDGTHSVDGIGPGEIIRVSSPEEGQSVTGAVITLDATKITVKTDQVNMARTLPSWDGVILIDVREHSYNMLRQVLSRSSIR